MADCSPAALVESSKCVSAGMSDHQLLASIAYQLAVASGGSTDPEDLVAESKCFTHLGDRQLLAIIALLQCELVPA